jgi:hypothetical protein
MEEAAAKAAASYIIKQQPDPGTYSLIAMCSGEAIPELRMMELLADKGYKLKRVWLIDLRPPPDNILKAIQGIVASSGTSPTSSTNRVKRLTFPEMTKELANIRMDFTTTHCISIHFQIISEMHPKYRNGQRWRHWSELRSETIQYETAKKMQDEDIEAIRKLVHSDVGAFFKAWMKNQKSIGFAARDGNVWEVKPEDVMSDGKPLDDAEFYNRVNKIQTAAYEKAKSGGKKKRHLKTSTKSKGNKPTNALR